MNIVEEIKKRKIVAIVRGVKADDIIYLSDALTEGGISLIEITFDQRSDEGIRETMKSLSRIHSERRDKVILGAGTVLTSKQVELAHESGAEYIITPNVNHSVIQKAKELGMSVMAGALTPTEIEDAYRAGADIVKVFPAGNLGASYIRAVRGPMPHIPVSAVGGIDEKNIKAFFEAGVCSVGVGGNLVDKRAIQNREFDKITQTAERLTAALA